MQEALNAVCEVAGIVAMDYTSDDSGPPSHYHPRHNSDASEVCLRSMVYQDCMRLTKGTGMEVHYYIDVL